MGTLALVVPARETRSFLVAADTPPSKTGILTTGSPFQTGIPTIPTSSPLANGIIVHIVETGQTLYSIAIAYGVTVDQIKSMNNMTEDQIFVGDRLIIRLGNTPTVTILPTGTPTRTLRPTRTVIPSSTHPTSPTPSLPDSTEAAFTQSAYPPPGTIIKGIDPLLLIIGGLALSGVILMIIGTLLKKRY